MYSGASLLQHLKHEAEIERDQCFHCLRVIGNNNPNATYDNRGRALVCDDCRPTDPQLKIYIVQLPCGRYFNPKRGTFHEEIPH